MNKHSAFATAGVLGAVACILVLAMLAACGGGGSNGASMPQSQFGRITSAKRVVVQFTGLVNDAADVDDAITFSAPMETTVVAGQTTTVDFAAP